VRYTPKANFHGVDAFSYTVCDNGRTNGAGDPRCAGATITVTVIPVNDAPTATGDSTTTNEDTPGGVDVLANDSDLDGDPISLVGATNGANGSVICAASICTYTPNANFNGTDSFAYTITDTGGLTSTATVNVAVNPVNDPPNAANDSLTTHQGVAGTVDVLANDSDIDGGPLAIIGSTDGGGGTVGCSGSSCTYTPNAGFSGSDGFTYTIGDGLGGTATGTVTVTVTPLVVPPSPAPLNRPPSCSGVTATPPMLWPANGRVGVVGLAGATDPDGDTLTFRITGVTQDEAVERGPDAQQTSQPNQILLRAERGGSDDGGRGDGRVYRIAYTVSDGTVSCSGVAIVGVPRRKGQTPVDSGGSFNSFATSHATPLLAAVTHTDVFKAVGQFKVHSIPITANVETVEIKIKWKRKGDRFVVRKVRIYSGGNVVARGPSLVDRRRPKKLKIAAKGTPTSTTVRIRNLAPGTLKFNLTARKLLRAGRTGVTTQVRRIPK
jgi:Bacterial Ig domain